MTQPLGQLTPHPVTHNLGACSFVPRAVRTAVFKYGTHDPKKWLEPVIINRFQNHFSGNSFFSSRSNFNADRAQGFVNLLRDLGAEFVKGEDGIEGIVPKDKEARLQVVRLTHSSLKSKIEALGGRWEIENGKYAIKPPEEKSSEWDDLYLKLKRIFPNKDRSGSDTYHITSFAVKNRDSIDKKTKCILFSRFGKSFVMNKFEIGYFLGNGFDVCLYDTRGILNSFGYPSEAGLYRDIEAVGSYLMGNYTPEQVCVYASCGESLTAMHLFTKFQSEGINMLLVKSPASLERVLSRINCLAAAIFRSNSQYVRAPTGSSLQAVEEDGFNSLGKLKALEFSEKAGSIILVKTRGDGLALERDTYDFQSEFERIGNKVVVLENIPRDTGDTSV